MWNDAPDRGIGATYHLAGTGETSWFGLAECVMSECRKRSLPAAEVLPIATADWPTRAARPAELRPRFAQVRACEFGFAMPRWQPSVAAVVDRLAAG